MKDHITDREILQKYRNALNDGIQVRGKWKIEVTRADGTVEHRECENIVTAAGLTELALRTVDNTRSGFIFLGIGTQTAAHSLGSVQGGIGEVERKAASIAAGSNEVAVVVMTWAGAADSITSLDLRTGAIFNHGSSGSGIMLNAVNSVATILADSDFLKLQAEVQIGSHNL